MSTDTNYTPSHLLPGLTIFAGANDALRQSAVRGACAFAADATRQPRALPMEGGFHESLAAAMRSDPDVLMVPLIRSELDANALIEMVRAGKRVICGMACESTDSAVALLKSLGLQDDILELTAVHAVTN